MMRMNSKQYARKYEKERIVGIIKKAEEDIKENYNHFSVNEAYYYNQGMIEALRNDIDIITAKTYIELRTLNHRYYKENNNGR